ncbi:hypothetical protein N374_gp058 [Bacillus phage phiNIT1]|uniref:Uncharacterized protein n=1 Tax=Bacillus phage phiNIT1 TaxID=207656 RepID=S6ATM3_9CAUD|nr:hypothetical protein N374_gp058 [Bacillus phage phiNIT1]BAN59581.1 hypothetical protein [Bacillus phage phiNIT1]
MDGERHTLQNLRRFSHTSMGGKCAMALLVNPMMVQVPKCGTQSEIQTSLGLLTPAVQQTRYLPMYPLL